MPATARYWLSNPDAPYATFLSVLNSYLLDDDPDEEALRDRTTKYAEIDEMVTFKKELREVIANPGVLPKDALRTAAYYEDRSEAAFLARLWHDLYGNEPV